MKDEIKFIESAHVRFHQNLHLRPREIENHRFLFVETGHGEFLFPGTKLKIDSRTLLLLSPGLRETRYVETTPVSYLYVEFHAPDNLIATPYREVPQTSAHFQTLVNLLWSIEREKGNLTEYLIPAALELTLRHPTRPTSREVDPRIQSTLDYIDRHLDQPIKISQLAARAGLSLPQFRRLFVKAVAKPPKEYLLRERMRYARKILQTEGLRIGEIAELMNFESVYQFSNQYKKVHGHSPRQDRPE